jgi:energy-coupling factor transporter ATP-binding protein EcfA2
MSNSYFEQSPISDIQISELKLPLSGLIVLVGANSSGKTNLLRELHAAISGTERPLIVAKEIRFRPAPGFNDYLVHLQQTGDMESVPISGGGAPQYRKIRHQYGTQTGTGGQWQEQELKGWYSQFENYTSQPLSKRLLSHTFLAQIGLMQCSIQGSSLHLPCKHLGSTRKLRMDLLKKSKKFFVEVHGWIFLGERQP